MLKVIRSETRQIDKSVKILRDLLKFVHDLDSYELVVSGEIPRVVGYSIPFTAVDPTDMRNFFDSNSKFLLSHTGQYSLLMYRYKEYQISITFRGKHSNLSIKEIHERFR